VNKIAILLAVYTCQRPWNTRQLFCTSYLRTSCLTFVIHTLARMYFDHRWRLMFMNGYLYTSFHNWFVSPLDSCTYSLEYHFHLFHFPPLSCLSLLPPPFLSVALSLLFLPFIPSLIETLTVVKIWCSQRTVFSVWTRCRLKARSTPATMSKQHCLATLHSGIERRSLTLLQHCCRFWQQCCRFRQPCRTKFRPFDLVRLRIDTLIANILV